MLEKKILILLLFCYSSIGLSEEYLNNHSFAFQSHDLAVEYGNPQANVYDVQRSYITLLNKIADRRIIYNSKSIVPIDITNYLYKILYKNIIPYWYGTKWDFNGISQKPGQGEIACGYFVSTLLKQIGFNLNRYKLAQQPASLIVKSLSGRNNVKWFDKIGKIKAYINNKPDSIYVLGLDNHVGFIIKDYDKIYFIHSSYIDPYQVVKERVDDSIALKNSKNYVLGDILNTSLVLKWAMGDKIKVIKMKK